MFEKLHKHPLNQQSI